MNRYHCTFLFALLALAGCSADPDQRPMPEPVDASAPDVAPEASVAPDAQQGPGCYQTVQAAYCGDAGSSWWCSGGAMKGCMQTGWWPSKNAPMAWAECCP